jgi:hypothetical protein
MENQVSNRMNFEQFLRGSLNARSEKAPKSLSEAIQDPNLPHGIKMFHGGTFKHRIDCLDSVSEGIMLGSADESFSIRPISEEQEKQIEGYTRQFYENAGYRFDKKDSSGLSDSYFFKNGSGDIVIVTCTLPLDNEVDGLLVSTSKVNYSG